MNSRPERWTREERRQALKAFFESEDGRRFLDVFSLDCTADDREVFLRDAERRFRFDDEEAGRWWDSLRALVESAQFLALAEPLAQNGIAVEELYECLPDNFDPLALIRAISLARNVRSGTRGGLSLGITNTAGWTNEQIRSRLEQIKRQLDFESANGFARRWWETFENENQQRLALVLRLAEELASRKVTVAEFHEAFSQANTENIQAVLHYLDYLRLMTQAAQSQVAGRSGLLSGDTGWWLKPAPRMTRVRGWTDEQIRRRLEEVKAQVDWESATDQIRVWWEAFEQENQQRLALVLRLAEELADRKTTIAGFHRSFGLSKANDIQANLSYLDYTRLTTEEYEYETVALDETGKITERRWFKARQFIEELGLGVTLEMVEVPGGEFTMGSNENDREKPPHRVKVSPFLMGKYQVTQAQWRAVAAFPKVEIDLNPDPAHFKGDDLPVETVSWEEAVEFCARLSQKTGQKYRLPSEAEWEYAARAGTSTPFAFGETITPEIVNYNGDYPYASAPKGENRGQTVEVGSLGVANAFGLYDMHGNVWEWCEDHWHDNYDGAPADGSAWVDISADGSNRVDRGGGWSFGAALCRSANRDGNAPGIRGDDLGFRLLRTYR